MAIILTFRTILRPVKNVVNDLIKNQFSELQIVTSDSKLIRINYQELRNNSQTEASCFRLYLDIRIFEFCFTTLKSWIFYQVIDNIFHWTQYRAKRQYDCHLQFLSRITCLSSEKYWTKFEQFLEWLSVNNKLVLLYNKYIN
jgi:hypothetical protein